jgi:hypothetical protein
MSTFTIFNPETRHIACEMEFPHYHAADAYRKEHFAEGYIAKHEPFHFSSNFKRMLAPGTHERVKTNRWGDAAAIVGDDGRTIYHCGGITLGEWDAMNRARIPSVHISKTQFINLHNSLVSC